MCRRFLLATLIGIFAVRAQAANRPSTAPTRAVPFDDTVYDAFDNSHVPVADPTDPDGAKADAQAVLDLAHRGTW